MKKIAIVFSTFFIIISCSNGKNKLILKSSTGRINSVLVVIKNGYWVDEVGKTLKDIFKSPVAGLSQPEAQFSVTHIKPNLFGDLFNNSRNILIVGIEAKARYRVIKNKYASPQIIMTITGKNESDLINKIKLHKQDILDIFKKGDLALYQQKLSKKDWPTNKFLASTNFTIDVPKDYRLVENRKDFLWVRKHLRGDNMINILIYKLPFNKQSSLTKAYIIKKRDSIGKAQIPGQFKDTYMQTSSAINPFLKKITVNGITAFVTKGLWNVKKDFMGGPFVNYTYTDIQHHQYICLDGFVYAPNKNKRDYIFELEAIFRTLKLK